MSKIKIPFLIIFSFVLVFSTLPIEYLIGSAANDNEYTVIKDNIKVPNIVAENDGVYYSPNTWTGQIGDITIPVPNRKKITSVQVLDSKGKYIKHIYPRTGNTYAIGSIQNIGSVDLKAVTNSNLGYFEWWQTSGNKAVWAFDFDGVRHFRKFNAETSYPISSGTYQNIRQTETPRANGYTTKGVKPSWYNTPTANHNLVFDDEVPGQANIGWASRDIPVTNTNFFGSGLNVPINKLTEVSARVDYDTSRIEQRSGYIPPSNILKSIVMNSSDDIIEKKSVQLWFRAKMGSYGTSYRSDNNLLIMRYYNAWNITLTTTLYKYDTYKVVAYYEDVITNDAELTVEADLNACLVVGTNVQLVSTILKNNGYKWTFLTTTPHEKLVYKSSNTKIATVSDTGLVKIVGEGNATIIATYTEGDGSPPLVVNKPVTAKVNCTAPPIEIPDLPDVSKGSCKMPNALPKEYEYELDLEVTKIVSNTVEIGQQATTNVTVKRADFTNNRISIENSYENYLESIQAIEDDCNDLITIWTSEKKAVEIALSQCLEAKELATKTNQGTVDCQPFNDKLNEVNTNLKKANEMISLYKENINKVNAALTTLATKVKSNESIEATVYLVVNNQNVTSLKVNLKEGESKNYTFPKWTVKAVTENIYAQINTSGPHQEFAYTNLHSRIKGTRGYHNTLGHELYPKTSSNNWKGTVQNTMPSISGGACGNPSTMPASYDYELDLLVTRIDARTADLNAQTDTDVYVERANFSANRGQAKADFTTYKAEITLLNTDCATLVTKWTSEKQTIEAAKVACEQALANGTGGDCALFTSKIAEVTTLITNANKKIAEYTTALTNVATELGNIQKAETANESVNPTVFLYTNGSTVSTLKVTLKEGESKRLTMPKWKVTKQDQLLYAQINTDGAYQEFAYTDRAKGTKESRGFNKTLGNVLYPDKKSNNWKDVIQHVADYSTNACPPSGQYFEPQSIKSIVRAINDNGVKRDLYEELTVSFTKVPREKMRAGYGFDYQVQTKYVNHDNEPNPVGVTDTTTVESYFPTMVDHQPYTKGGAKQNFTLKGEYTTVDLGYRVPMKVKSNVNQIGEWILPPVAVENYSGNVFTMDNNDHQNHTARNVNDTLITTDSKGNALNKWYTNFTDPDGAYEFIVKTYNTGINHMSTCLTGVVQIEGVTVGDGSGDGNDDFVKRSITPTNPFPAGIGWNWNGNVSMLTNLTKWYNEWDVANPQNINTSAYEHTFYLTPETIRKINAYVKEHPNIKLGEFVTQQLNIPTKKE